jgi:hypothetical protein
MVRRPFMPGSPVWVGPHIHATPDTNPAPYRGDWPLVRVRARSNHPATGPDRRRDPPRSNASSSPACRSSFPSTRSRARPTASSATRATRSKHPARVSTITAGLVNERAIDGLREILEYSPGAYAPSSYGELTVVLHPRRCRRGLPQRPAPQLQLLRLPAVVQRRRGRRRRARPGSVVFGAGYLTGGYVNYVTKQPKFSGPRRPSPRASARGRPARRLSLPTAQRAARHDRPGQRQPRVAPQLRGQGRRHLFPPRRREGRPAGPLRRAHVEAASRRHARVQRAVALAKRARDARRQPRQPGPHLALALLHRHLRRRPRRLQPRPGPGDGRGHAPPRDATLLLARRFRQRARRLRAAHRDDRPLARTPRSSTARSSST